MRQVFIVATVMALSFLSCKTRQADSSHLQESQAGAFKSQIATFKKIVGRSPSAEELKPMKGLSYEQQVDFILNSEYYQKEGFLNLHTNRLLLNRQGNDSWIQGSDYDFCSLRWEFEESAKADQSGEGYWDLLRHRTRWHAVDNTQFVIDPFTCSGITSQQILDLWKANNNSFDGVPPENEIPACITNMSSILPRNGVFASFFDPAQFSAFVPAKFIEYIGTFPPNDLPLPLNSSSVFKKDFFDARMQGLNGSSLISIAGAEVVKTGDDIPIRRLTDRSDCSFSEGKLDTTIADTSGPFYIQLKLPEKAAGIHSNPYYLNRHTSSPANGQLHRGRMMLYSYFCTDISPDAANAVGGPAVKIPEHDLYFNPNDTHAQKAANCYNCHTKVQPMGNFFLAMADGMPYDNSNFQISPTGSWGSLRKGGYNDGTGFFPISGESDGMDGLANLLSQHPSVKSCLVNTAWSQLVGRDYPLSVTEKKAAIDAFSKPPVRYASLIKHLMVSNERGKIYFERGEAAMAKVKVDNEVDCDAVLSKMDDEKARLKVAGTCAASCHARPFSDKEGNVSPEIYYSDKNISKVKTAALWKKVYCQVKTGQMPPSGIEQEERNLLSCIMERKVKGLVASNVLPADPDAFECESPVPTLNNAPLHN